MSDRRSAWLQYSILVLVVLNLGLTLYFNVARTSAVSSPQDSMNEAHQITEKEALAFARSVVDLYNDDKTHELYRHGDTREFMLEVFRDDGKRRYVVS